MVRNARSYHNNLPNLRVLQGTNHAMESYPLCNGSIVTTSRWNGAFKENPLEPTVVCITMLPAFGSSVSWSDRPCTLCPLLLAEFSFSFMASLSDCPRLYLIFVSLFGPDHLQLIASLFITRFPRVAPRRDSARCHSSSPSRRFITPTYSEEHRFLRLYTTDLLLFLPL